MSVAAKVARASGKKKPSRLKGPTSPFIGVDTASNQSASWARVAKKKYGPGGPSRRGSHAMSNAGGCEVRYYWSDHVGLKPLKGSNFYMDFGTLGHTAMAYFYADKMTERKPKWYDEYPDREKALHSDADGNPSWLRNMTDLMSFYKKYEAGDPWEPIYIEEEFEATVGEIDPDGDDEPAESIEYIDAKGEKKVHVFPNLNSEIVTCRPDLVVKRNGFNWIIDHKIVGGGKKDRERLPVINDQYPDYKYSWQQMVNLLIVRKGRCVEAPGEKLPVQGFILNRVKRDNPFDVSRDLVSVSPRMYQKIPKTIRETVRKSRALKKKALLAPSSLVAHPWECEASWKCDYVRVCYSTTLSERDQIISTEYGTEE